MGDFHHCGFEIMAQNTGARQREPLPCGTSLTPQGLSCGQPLHLQWRKGGNNKCEFTKEEQGHIMFPILGRQAQATVTLRHSPQRRHQEDKAWLPALSLSPWFFPAHNGPERRLDILGTAVSSVCPRIRTRPSLTY